MQDTVVYHCTVDPLHSWPMANQSMKWLHIDFAEIEEFWVLVIIDIHSKWIEAIHLHNATATTTFKHWKLFYSSFGLLVKLLVIMGLHEFTASTPFPNILWAQWNQIFLHTPLSSCLKWGSRVVKEAMKKMEFSNITGQPTSRIFIDVHERFSCYHGNEARWTVSMPHSLYPDFPKLDTISRD